MGRSRGSPSRRSSSPRSSAPPPSHAAKPTASHNTTGAQSNAHTAAAQPQVTNVYVQRPGFGGGGSGMLGTMAAVAGGSVLGHGISHYLYGHGNQAPTQPAEAQELAQAAAKENNVCAPQLGGYSKCLEANPESADNCRWAWDYFLQCRSANQSDAAAAN